MSSPQLILMCGYPGSGKSHALRSSRSAVILCPDDFRAELTGHEFYVPAEEFVWGSVKLTARVLLRRGYTVIIDGTHLTASSRAQWMRISQSLNTPIECLWVDVPFEICQQRNRDRGRVVPEDVMTRMHETFEPPTLAEGFRNIYRLEDDNWIPLQAP